MKELMLARNGNKPVPGGPSARMAWRFHRQGIWRVRPLLGGIDAWRERHYPSGTPHAFSCVKCRQFDGCQPGTKPLNRCPRMWFLPCPQRPNSNGHLAIRWVRRTYRVWPVAVMIYGGGVEPGSSPNIERPAKKFRQNVLPHTYFPFMILFLDCAVSSVVEHYLDTVGVTGSNPVSRTIS